MTSYQERHLGDMAVVSGPRLLPTSDGRCGYGEEVAGGAVFARGHDKVSEAALICS